jgi:acyl-CoA synthetase (AMP-forming)/AMP-acid ligase II
MTQQIKVRAKQGIEIPGVEMRVVMEDGNIAPRDGKSVGEFEVKGPWIIKEYYLMMIMNILQKMVGSKQVTWALLMNMDICK